MNYDIDMNCDINTDYDIKINYENFILKPMFNSMCD